MFKIFGIDFQINLVCKVVKCILCFQNITFSVHERFKRNSRISVHERFKRNSRIFVLVALQTFFF
jgi:hypothetical protein